MAMICIARRRALLGDQQGVGKYGVLYNLQGPTDCPESLLSIPLVGWN